MIAALVRRLAQAVACLVGCHEYTRTIDPWFRLRCLHCGRRTPGFLARPRP